MNVGASGPVIGVIVRNSTYAQVGNYRSEVQSVDLPKRCETLGYAWQIYDEQGVSGKSLSAREQTRRALDDLRTGLIHGIGVLDVKRATRDEDCMDGRIIKQAVKQARAILVTRDKVYDFRNKSDARLWDIQALQAGWEWRDIRDTTWDGIMKRAEKMGDELMLRAVPPPGYQLVVKSFKKNGMPVRVPAKDPDEQPLIEELWLLLEELPSLNAVTKRLNREGKLRPRRRAEGGREWVTPDVSRILQNPIYKGVISFGRRREQAHRRGMLSDVLDTFEPTEHYMPELSYVTQSTWERLNDKFRRNGRALAKAGSMASRHTLSGILRCPICGDNVVGAGTTGYNCRRSVVGLCEGFRILDVFAEKQACEILDGVFAKLNVPENFEEAIQMERAAQPSDGRAVLEDELNDLEKQEDRLVDAIADGLIERESAQRKSARIKSRRLEIYEEIARIGTEKEGRQRALQYVQMARTAGIGPLVLGMPVEDKRKFFRAAFKTITLDGHGRGNWRKRWVKDYELSDALATFILKHASA
ncbi:MAG: recombinase family protein [Chloroflexota bacterium]|nr:recombinase family protein [Chloroflexota bacterium]